METTWVPEEIGLGGLMRTRGRGEFVPAKAHAKLTTGEVIRMLRELKGWTQAELARRSGISPTNISLLENEKVEIGKKRVEQLAKAFDIHPAIIMFPEYEAKEIQRLA
jgi:DNA-binding XRE family transcriptional regulator